MRCMQQARRGPSVFQFALKRIRSDCNRTILATMRITRRSFFRLDTGKRPAWKAKREDSWHFVQATVDARIPNHRLHVISRFCEGYRLHKCGHVTEGEVRAPLFHSAVAGIIGRERILHMSVVVIQQPTKHEGTQSEIGGWSEQLLWRGVSRMRGTGELFAAAGQYLHQSNCLCARNSSRLEL
jgi:hypothetical protein